MEAATKQSTIQWHTPDRRLIKLPQRWVPWMGQNEYLTRSESWSVISQVLFLLEFCHRLLKWHQSPNYYINYIHLMSEKWVCYISWICILISGKDDLINNGSKYFFSFPFLLSLSTQGLCSASPNPWMCPSMNKCFPSTSPDSGIPFCISNDDYNRGFLCPILDKPWPWRFCQRGVFLSGIA